MSEMIERVVARRSGRLAFCDGKPCIAPDYGRTDLEASWRIGWKIEAGLHESTIREMREIDNA